MGMTSGENQNEDSSQTMQTEIPLDTEAQLLALQVSAREGLEHVNKTKEKISKLNQLIKKQWNEIELVKSRCWELQDSIDTTKRLERIALKVTWSKLSELESDLEKAKEDTARHLRIFQLTNKDEKTSYQKKAESEQNRIVNFAPIDIYANPYAQALAALEADAATAKVIEPEALPEIRNDNANSESENAVKDLAGLEVDMSDFEAEGSEKSQEDSLSTSLGQSKSGFDNILMKTEMSETDSESKIIYSSSKVETSENDSECEVSENPPQIKISVSDFGVRSRENKHYSGVKTKGNSSGVKNSSSEDKCIRNLPGVKSIRGNSTKFCGSTMGVKINKTPLGVKINKSDSGLKNKNGSLEGRYSETSLETKISRGFSGVKIDENPPEVKQGESSSTVKISRIPSRVKVSDNSLEVKSSGRDLGVKSSRDPSGVKSIKYPPGVKHPRIPEGGKGGKAGGNFLGVKHDESPLEAKRSGTPSRIKRSEKSLGVTGTGGPTVVQAGGGPVRTKHRQNVSRVKESGNPLGGRQSEHPAGVRQRERVSEVKNNECSSKYKCLGRPSEVKVHENPSGVNGSRNPREGKSQDSFLEGKSFGSLSELSGSH